MHWLNPTNQLPAGLLDISFSMLDTCNFSCLTLSTCWRALSTYSASIAMQHCCSKNIQHEILTSSKSKIQYKPQRWRVQAWMEHKPAWINPHVNEIVRHCSFLWVKPKFVRMQDTGSRGREGWHHYGEWCASGIDCIADRTTHIAHLLIQIISTITKFGNIYEIRCTASMQLFTSQIEFHMLQWLLLLEDKSKGLLLLLFMRSPSSAIFRWFFRFRYDALYGPVLYHNYVNIYYHDKIYAIAIRNRLRWSGSRPQW